MNNVLTVQYHNVWSVWFFFDFIYTRLKNLAFSIRTFSFVANIRNCRRQICEVGALLDFNHYVSTILSTLLSVYESGQGELIERRLLKKLLKIKLAAAQNSCSQGLVAVRGKFLFSCEITKLIISFSCSFNMITKFNQSLVF